MKNWIKRHPILLAFLLLGSSVGGLNYSGFCIPEGRWLSDEEKIRALENYLPIEYPEYVYQVSLEEAGETKKIKTGYLNYSNRAEFLEKNPDCCKIGAYDIGAGNWTPPFPVFNRMRGAYLSTVTATYKIYFSIPVVGETYDLPIEGKTYKEVRNYYVISNCGRIWID